jgi:hypothetical protein
MILRTARTILLERLCAAQRFVCAPASRQHTSVFFYYSIIITDIDDDGMEKYSTIIWIQVADAGEARDEFVGWGGTLAGGDGRYQINTADKKNRGEFWGNTTIINCTPVVAGGFFYFLPIQIMIYSNIFECWCNGFNDDTQHNITCYQRESNNPP